MSTSLTNILTISNLNAFRGNRLVLKNVNFSLSSGESLIIQGPNGVGKSTLLRILAGFKKQDAGEILWNTTSIKDPDLNYPQKIAWLSHLDSLKPALTVTENLFLIHSIYKTNINQALKSMQLDKIAHLPVRMLSAGQKRRVAIARILLKPAQLWLLDEPTVGLDQETIQNLAHIFTNFKEQGGMIITTTHIPLPLKNSKTLQLTPTALPKVSI